MNAPWCAVPHRAASHAGDCMTTLPAPFGRCPPKRAVALAGAAPVAAGSGPTFVPVLSRYLRVSPCRNLIGSEIAQGAVLSGAHATAEIHRASSWHDGNVAARGSFAAAVANYRISGFGVTRGCEEVGCGVCEPPGRTRLDRGTHCRDRISMGRRTSRETQIRPTFKSDA